MNSSGKGGGRIWCDAVCSVADRKRSMRARLFGLLMSRPESLPGSRVAHSVLSRFSVGTVIGPGHTCTEARRGSGE
jgi:hypothetical protein